MSSSLSGIRSFGSLVGAAQKILLHDTDPFDRLFRSQVAASDHDAVAAPRISSMRSEARARLTFAMMKSRRPSSLASELALSRRRGMRKQISGLIV